MQPDAPLAGIQVLVTRPAARAAALCAMIEKHGGTALKFPVIEIAPPADAGALAAALQNLGDAALAIFVSVPAVHAAAAALARHGLTIPPVTRVAAVGPKTAAACAAAGIKTDFAARGEINSEGLLDALRDFDAAGREVVIFRAQSGRGLLKRALQTRGARVRHVEAYRRKIIAPPPLCLRAGKTPVAVAGSVAVAEALLQAPARRDRDALRAMPVFAYSPRIAAHCRAADFGGEIITAAQPTDEGVVEAMREWASARAQSGIIAV